MSDNTALVQRVVDAQVLPEEWNRSAWVRSVTGTIWKDLKPEEVMVMAAFCGQTQLDPFRKEVFCIQGNPFVGRDGFITVMQRHPRYGGHIAGLIYEFDEFEVVNGMRAHRYGSPDKRGRLTGAYITIKTKDGFVETFTRQLADYKALWQKPNWKKDMPGMVLNRVITFGARAMFSLGSLYTVDEAAEVLQGQVVVEDDQATIAYDRLKAITETLTGRGGSQGEPEEPTAEETDSDPVEAAEDEPAPPPDTKPEQSEPQAMFERMCLDAEFDIDDAYKLLLNVMKRDYKSRLKPSDYNHVINDWASFDVLMREPQLNI